MSELEEYFDDLKKEVNICYNIANAARVKGLDPVDSVECPLALTMAERAVNLVKTIYPKLNVLKVSDRILELEAEYGKLDVTVAFVIAREIAEGGFGKFESELERIDIGIRVGFAYMTLGVVASPIEGYTGLKLGSRRSVVGSRKNSTQNCDTSGAALRVEAKNDKKDKYFIASFSGPIRSAGTTATCLVLMLIDYLRDSFGYAKYDASEVEVRRYIQENKDYHERVSNLAYFPTEEEMRFLAERLPIQIDGDPTERLEVSNFRDLARVETNYIRGGMCLIFSEGLAQKAEKALGRLESCRKNGLDCNGFDWLKDYVVLHKKRASGSKDMVATYIKDIVAGRPVYGHPGRSGGFRFRYGRSRTSGFSGVSVHPATMGITGGFLSNGTQLRLEKPTKACIITSCDSIDGPIVKLKNGSVRKLEKYDEALKLYSSGEVEEIVYLGDILFPVGDIIDRNFDLIIPGYVEEWWEAELDTIQSGVGDSIKNHGTSAHDFLWKLKDVDLDLAVKLSEEFKIPLHPEFIFYWSQISNEEFIGLLRWLNGSEIRGDKLVLNWEKGNRERFGFGKRALEILGVRHEVVLDNVVVSEDARSLLFNLGKKEVYKGEVLEFKVDEVDDRKVLDIVNELCDFEIKDKAGTFIGARMGRPEKAKLRKLVGSPNSLFPVGDSGGRLRSFQDAVEKGFVKGDFPVYRCECGVEGIFERCESCGGNCKKLGFCKSCGEVKDGNCKLHGDVVGSYVRKVDIGKYFKKAVLDLGFEDFEVPPLVKGVKRLSSESKIPENLAKGILRAKHNLSVNKDGTVRYDAIEIPLTHFRAREIGVSVEKIREIGYLEDIKGDDLVSADQVLELRPHDIVLPSCLILGEERADRVFQRIGNFIDDELERVYGLDRFYNFENRDDLIGVQVVCMAPHNCAGVIGRIIGFSNIQGLLASPFMHAAMRRDCFDYNTFISVNENGRWKNIKIGEMVEGMTFGKVVDGFGTEEFETESCKTIGFDKEMRDVGINNFTKHKERGMFRIKTALGKEISVSENHKFLVNGKKKLMGDLKIGDKLPLPYNIEIKSEDKSEVNLLEELRGENLMVRGIRGIVEIIDVREILVNLNISGKQFLNFKNRDSYPSEFVFALNKEVQREICRVGRLSVKRDNIEVPIIVKLSDELLEVVGLYIAEGFSRSVVDKKGLNQVDIASIDEDLKIFIRRVIFEHFKLKSVKSEDTRVMFSSRILYLFFTRIFGCGSIAREKRISSDFLDLPLDRLACILRGYFEGDGSVSLSDRRVSCDSVSEGLLFDLEFCLGRFGIFLKKYKYKKKPGPKIREFYIKKKREVPEFEITKGIIGSDFVSKFERIGFLSKRKQKILNFHLGREGRGMRIDFDENFVYDPVVDIEYIGERESYCLNINTKEHLVSANSIVSFQCDGDEAAVMLLMDVLLNFSKEFLPSHRGGRQDAPLVLNARIRAGEVDDQILFFEAGGKYPLELYEAAERGEHSSMIRGKIDLIGDRLKRGEAGFVGNGFSHDSCDINFGNNNGIYKSLPTMKEKVSAQMALVGVLRGVDEDDVARLVLERHFIRDIRGNLRKFMKQGFRCSSCNEKFRRPPLVGVCTKCKGKLIFTISEGSVRKYVEPAMELVRDYKISSYTKESMELIGDYIERIFGKGEEQVMLGV